jgi:hypothetical protein
MDAGSCPNKAILRRMPPRVELGNALTGNENGIMDRNSLEAAAAPWPKAPVLWLFGTPKAEKDHGH